MRIKKYLLIFILALIFANITCIDAMDNDTYTTDSMNQDFIDSDNDVLANMSMQKNTNDATLQSKESDQLVATGPSPPDNNFWNNENGKIYHTQLTLTVTDTTSFGTAKNATMHLHLDWDLYMNQEYYNSCLIQIYENDTIINTFNISDQSDTAYGHNAHQTLDVTFPYTIKDRTELKAVLLEIESNTLSFEEIKKIGLTNLRHNSIMVNGNGLSNENWTNQLKYLKKAIDEAPANGIILLNNVEIINDEGITITIDKNLTIIGNNATINGLEHGTIFAINQQANVALINLTFTNTTTNYIIRNNGNLKIININFSSNVGRIIINNGDLTLENCIIENTTKKYYAQSLNNMITTSENGLIYNTKTLLVKNTTFNNIDLHPLTVNGKKLDWTGIIANLDKTQITGCRFTNINYMAISNKAMLEINDTLMESITSTGITTHNVEYTNQLNGTVKFFSYRKAASSLDGGALYNDDLATITNSSFKKITGTNGAILNKKNLNVMNATFQSMSNGAIYNKGMQLTIESSLFSSASINNERYCQINNSTLTKSSISNEGNMIVNNTIISDNNGLALSNSGTMTIANSRILNNNGGRQNVILNRENGKFLLEKSLIKDNSIATNLFNGEGKGTYGGVIKNEATMEITGCLFDNNKASDWVNGYSYVLQGGAINIYNNGKISVMYNYLLNTQELRASQFQAPTMFLYHVGDTCNINYNFFCLDPNKIIKYTNPNYYFIPAFEDDYYPIKLNENANITLTLGLTNGTDKIDFDDWDRLLTPGLDATITTIDENGEYINITTFLKDKYTFNFNYTNTKAIYTIYSNILNYKNTGIVDVGKEFAEMTVTYNNNITYNDGNKFTFHIKVTGNLTNQPTGNVTLTYNNKKVVLNLTDGECNYTIDETLKPANYTMRIDYNGDEEYFRIIKQFYPFTVNKISTNITLVAPEIKIGETGKLTITITPGDAKLYGYLYYTTDRLHEVNADTRGTRTLNLKNFPVGTHNLTVIFDEDEYYTGGTFTTFFTVSKYETQLNVTAADVPPGQDNTTVNITINPGDVRGEAIVEINGKNETVYLNDTTTRIPVTDLEEGTYTVNIYYPGDAKYAPSNGTTTFSVARITSKITCEISYDEHMSGHVTVNANHNNCTGEVRLYINNDDPLKLNLTDGKANFTVKFKRGVNYIYLYYYGDEYYSFSTWNRTFSIDATPVLSLETQDLRSNSTGYVRINLTDTNAIPYEYTDITIEFNNQTTTLKTDENGTVYYPVQVPAGKYSIKATYGNATITKTITVKTTTKITVEIPSIKQDEDLMAYVTLTDCNNQKITGDVIIEINGQYYKIIVTNGAGSRNLGELKANNYKYNATYIGEGLLSSSQTTGSFNVAANNYRITGNKNINAYYGANKNYKIQLLNNNKPVKDAIITIKINKNTVQVKTDSQGYATLKLSLKAGKYTIVSTYKNVKATNKIVIKPTLITKNKKIKKGKTLTYTAKLLNKNGKKQKNKKITFKINGKKYKAKTNKKGIAKIKVKNLKKGKYKIKTSYGKLKNTNTITVK